ncbi:type II toxin-antitoxin system VapC family toxin [Amycolatopsis japonica]|uniref:type II toxin-antitoxin system VapC family toxin n=1 Tax=Amycolatopsis japonica TaxID=208439 RepID=UPI00381C0067
MTEAVLLDTSAVIALPRPEELALDAPAAISSITLAELAAGVHGAARPRDRASRLVRLQRVEARMVCLPFTPEAARMYGQLYAMVLDGGRQPRGRRMDLLIAAVAAIHRIPLVTRNGADFTDLAPLVKVIALPALSTSD